MLFDSYEEEESVSYWPSAADLFMTLFIISIAAIAAVMVALLPTSDFSDQEAINNAVGTDMAKIRKPVGELRSTLKLPAISPAAKPDHVIAKLGETCVVAIERLKILSSNDLAGELEKLQSEVAELKLQLEAQGRELKETRSALAEARKRIEPLKTENKKLRELLGDKAKFNRALAMLNAKSIDGFLVKLKELIEANKETGKPPIINLTGRKDDDDPNALPPIVFSSGNATLKPEFVTALRRKTFPEVSALLKQYSMVDTLEIVGHTDGAPVSGKSNLDQSIAEHFAGADNFNRMKAGSNCDLGLMRALAIRQEWLKWLKDTKQADGHLDKIDVRCYSAAQTVPPVGSPAANDPSVESHWLSPNQDARRIEIRFTQLKDSTSNQPPNRNLDNS